MHSIHECHYSVGIWNGLTLQVYNTMHNDLNKWKHSPTTRQTRDHRSNRVALIATPLSRSIQWQLRSNTSIMDEMTELMPILLILLCWKYQSKTYLRDMVLLIVSFTVGKSKSWINSIQSWMSSRWIRLSLKIVYNPIKQLFILSNISILPKLFLHGDLYKSMLQHALMTATQIDWSLYRMDSRLLPNSFFSIFFSYELQMLL